MNPIDEVTVVFNPDWESGIASSLAMGLEVAQVLGFDAAMVMTADQPLIDAASLRKLMDAFDDDHRIVAAAYAGVVGVPAIFGSEHFESLMALTGDEGAGRWLRSRLNEVSQIRIQKASIDIDTPDDVARLASDNFSSGQ